jgi:hypothetical protein
MSAAEQIPAMTDNDLARFHANTVRVHAAGAGPRFAQAADLLPLLEAEISTRLASKPPKKLTKAEAARQAKAAAESEAAEHAAEEAAEAEGGVEAVDA